MPFPPGDYTPHGYLRNPFQRASGAWERLAGGNLRTCDDAVGMEWAYAWHRGTSARAGISLTYLANGEPCVTRADFAAIGYTSRYHSSNVMGFDWTLDGIEVTARFFLVEDALIVRVIGRNVGSEPREARLGVLGRAWASQSPGATSDTAGSLVFWSTDGESPEFHALSVIGPGLAPSSAAERLGPAEGECRAGWESVWRLAPDESTMLTAALGRSNRRDTAIAAARAALRGAENTLAERIAEDDRFYATCPRLEGDWPANWREGLVYDFETTRMCVMPPGGIFSDVWPSWMVSWPRVVVAEGTLDMLRLSYADPSLAMRALLTLFRDAPEANVPCVFQDGSPNMVAADGSVCGTSPAWCLPFLNLELLYLRTLDRAWLGEIYPRLARYVAWWLENRTDAQGWVVYKCTWEAGEDGNRRLDPTASGNADISGRIRPVELQAALASAARALGFFAGELGLDDDVAAWQALERDYRDRTRALFDPVSQRFRDWLIQEHRFQTDSSGERYWGSDSLRFSALSLTPLLGGIASTFQVEALRPEVALHAAPPWTCWPSWCHVLTECASAAGLPGLAGEISWSVLDRVYRVTNRRSLDEIRRPTPGVAPEYWPSDWRTWDASDAYGWGATTANLVLRHLFGIQECRITAGWFLELVPSLPAALRRPGAQYTVRRVCYRDQVIDLTYRCAEFDLEVELELDEPRSASVTPAADPAVPLYVTDTPATRHTFYLVNDHRYRLELVS